jgi:hypothetical protein
MPTHILTDIQKKDNNKKWTHKFTQFLLQHPSKTFSFTNNIKYVGERITKTTTTTTATNKQIKLNK